MNRAGLSPIFIDESTDFGDLPHLNQDTKGSGMAHNTDEKNAAFRAASDATNAVWKAAVAAERREANARWEADAKWEGKVKAAAAERQANLAKAHATWGETDPCDTEADTALKATLLANRVLTSTDSVYIIGAIGDNCDIVQFIAVAGDGEVRVIELDDMGFVTARVMRPV